MSTWGPTAIAAQSDNKYGQPGGLSTEYGSVYFGNDSGTYYLGAVRFVNVAVPAGASISSATLTLQCFGTTLDPATGLHAVVVGDDVANAATWADSDTITNTTATTHFDPATFVSYTDYNIDITGIVSEIIGISGWASGNAMRFFVQDDSSTVLARFMGYAWNNGPGSARLTIEYTEAASFIPYPLSSRGARGGLSVLSGGLS
jgi:hypothetical protein